MVAEVFWVSLCAVKNFCDTVTWEYWLFSSAEELSGGGLFP